MTTTQDTPAQVAEREQIALGAAAVSRDPAERVTAAARVARDVQATAETLRTRRDQAVTALYLTHRWRPVKVYRTADITRSLFARIITRTPDRGPLPDEFVESETAAAAAAEELQVVAHLDAIGEAARTIRDQAICHELPDVTNADIARLTDLTTARVTQLRGKRAS